MNGSGYDNRVNEQAAGQEPYGPGPGAGIPPGDPAGIADRTRRAGPVSRKSPALATVLSLMPGLGQIYVGYYQQGFIFVLVCACTIAILNSMSGRAVEPFFGMFLAFFWVFNMIDANRRAVHYNRVADGLGGEEIPEDFALPGSRGSVGGGILLIVAGVLIFMDLNMGLSLEWLEDWWPLGLVGFGAWLIFKARRQGS